MSEMKKEELRNTLHQIQPDEALIRRTLDGIHEKRNIRPPRKFTVSSMYKLAGAMCALILIVGVGIMIPYMNVNPSDTPGSDVQPGVIDYPAKNGTDETGKIDADEAAEKLILQASELEENWVLIEGTMGDIYFRSSENGIFDCAVAIRSVTVRESSQSGTMSIPNSGEDIIAKISFTDDIEMEKFPELLGSKICVILTPCDDKEMKIAGYLFCQ